MFVNLVGSLCRKEGENSQIKKLVYPKTIYESDSSISNDKYKSLDGISVMSANPVIYNDGSSKNTFRTAN